MDSGVMISRFAWSSAGKLGVVNGEMGAGGRGERMGSGMFEVITSGKFSDDELSGNAIGDSTTPDVGEDAGAGG